MIDLTCPSGWSICSLGLLLDGIQSGKSVKCDERPPQGIEKGLVKISAVTWGEFNEQESKTLLSADHLLVSHKIQKGDLLISRANTLELVGATAIVKNLVKDLYLSDKVLRLETKSDFKPLIHAFLKSTAGRRQIEALATGNQLSMRNISQNALKSIQIPLIPLAEQKIIAQKLDTLLAQVENTKARLARTRETIKRFRQSVLAAAVSGKLTEEWRDNNPELSTEKMLAGFEPLKKPARWKSRSEAFIMGVNATAVGKPQNKAVTSWEWVPIVDVARMESGHTPSRSKPEYWGGDVYWIGIKDARHNHADTITDTEQKTNDLGLANSASRLLPVDTVCISRTASVGYVVKMGKPMATSQDFVNWVPSSVIDPDWLKWLFVAEKESLFKFGKGSTHTTVYFPEWLSMHIALPPFEEQREISRQIEQFFAHADTIEKQVEAAQTRVNNLTQSILAKAFRGELTEQWRRDNPELISGENSAEALLEKIKSERAIMDGKKIKARRKPKAKAETTA